jgi:hypothetical protein
MIFSESSFVPFVFKERRRHPGSPDPAAEPRARRSIAEADVHGLVFSLSLLRRSELPGAFGGGSDEWCLGEIDSRMPAVMSDVCGISGRAGFNVVNLQSSQGFARVTGLVTDEVARMRLVTEDGREFFVEPGPYPQLDGFPWRGFIAVAAGAEWFVTIEALDAKGNVIGAEDYSNHPTNP